MKTDLTFLPNNKQAELAQITSIITQAVPAEMVILFGSYARNEWVEEKYDDEHYRYQSDFDILVIVETKSEHLQSKFERDIEEKLEQLKDVNTPVSVIVHDIAFINRRLSKAQYFFTDIKKEGVILYDSGRHQLNEAKELLPQERKKMAQDDFDYYFEKAEKFKELCDICIEKQNYNEAAFLLHQTTERLYTAILLVFTHYKPNTHDLVILRKLTNSLDDRLARIFPMDSSENRRLFKLLRKAYVDARYKRSYKITKDELDKLIQRVNQLQEVGKLLCQEKIDSFVSNSDKV
jgi:uncharacterized protein